MRTERSGLIGAAVEAAIRWRQGQPDWMPPVEELRGQVAAAVEYLLDMGLVVPAQEVSRDEDVDRRAGLRQHIDLDG